PKIRLSRTVVVAPSERSTPCAAPSVPPEAFHGVIPPRGALAGAGVAPRRSFRRRLTRRGPILVERLLHLGGGRERNVHVAQQPAFRRRRRQQQPLHHVLRQPWQGRPRRQLRDLLPPVHLQFRLTDH